MFFIVLCWDNQKLLLDAVGLIFDPFRAVFQLSLCWYPSNENWPFVKGLQFFPQNVTKIVVTVNQMKIYFLVVMSDPFYFSSEVTHICVFVYFSIFILHLVVEHPVYEWKNMFARPVLEHTLCTLGRLCRTRPQLIFFKNIAILLAINLG